MPTWQEDADEGRRGVVQREAAAGLSLRPKEGHLLLDRGQRAN